MSGSRKPFDWVESLDSLADRYLEWTSRATRGLPIAVYLVLGSLALLQVVNPGALERIASQQAGRVLFAALSGLLLLSAVLTVGEVALRARGAPLAPGIGDAALHFSFAVIGLELSFGSDLLSAPSRAVLIGGLGLVCAGVGCYLLFSAARESRPIPGEWRDRRVRALVCRDDFVRGGVLVVLGALMFAAAVQNTPELGFDPNRQLLGLPLLLVTTLALTVYALHGIWSMREEGRIPLL